MKILKHGKFYGMNYPAKCGKCDCEFEYNFLELFRAPSEKGVAEYVSCPECESAVMTKEILPK